MPLNQSPLLCRLPSARLACSASSVLTNKSAPMMAGYIPPTLSARIIESMPTSSRIPLAISASAVDGNVEMAMRSGDFMVLISRRLLAILPPMPIAVYGVELVQTDGGAE